MIHWVESEDRRGLPSWLRFVECSCWGLIFTREEPRWTLWHLKSGAGCGVVVADAFC